MFQQINIWISNGTYFMSSLIFCSLMLLTNYQALNTLPEGEICDNAIDDDEDGLIDMNDEDCLCSEIESTSLIPNPSFEEKDCCPGFDALLDCATSWIPASAAPIHYFHSCAFTNFLIPQPIPDGAGVIGLTNGKIKEISNYKEYIGTCLSEPMKANVPYKFQFEIGISSELEIMPMNVSLFGTTNCEYLPFGGSSETIGCPTNTLDWIYLGETFVSSIAGWKTLAINFTPSADITAIALGPPCVPNDWRDTTLSAYYFFDNLILQKAYNFDFEIQMSDQPCANNLKFQVPYFESLAYQWYKDGIALINERENELKNIAGPGFYQVMIIDEADCFLSKAFEYSPPIVYQELRDTICEGGTYAFNGQTLNSSGFYQDTLKTANNCDSILQLVLIQDTMTQRSIFAKIFPFETYVMEGFKFNQQGTYTFQTQSEQNCEESINLTLAYYKVYIPNVFTPNGDGINDVFTIYGDEDIELILSLQIFDRWGGMVYNKENLLPNSARLAWDGLSKDRDVNEGVFTYVAYLLMEDMKSQVVSGNISLLR